jgi:hypothetical protein
VVAWVTAGFWSQNYISNMPSIHLALTAGLRAAGFLMRRRLAFTAAMLILGDSIRADSLNIHLGTVGSGRVETPCPEPYQEGQGFIVYATPAPGSRFVRWEDGSTRPDRYLVLRRNSTNLTASFEVVSVRPFLEEFGLDNLDPSKIPRATLQAEAGRLRLEFTLPGRNAYRVLMSTNLATDRFVPIPFANGVSAPLNQTQAIGNAGTSTVWTDAVDPVHAFFQIELIDGGVLPAIYLAQAPTVALGQSFHLYGLGFSRGTVRVESDRGPLTADVINDHTLRVSAPSAPGPLQIQIRVNGALALGSLTLQVSTQPSTATVAKLPQVRLIRGGLLRLTGTELNAATAAYIGSLPATILGRNPEGTSLALRLPQVPTTGALSLVVGGQLITSDNVTVENSIAGYTPFTSEGLRVTTTDFVRPNQLTYVPFVAEGFRITTIGFVRPSLIDYIPFVRQGILIETE